MGQLVPFPHHMYCGSCGRDRTVAPSAADPGPCECGATLRTSTPPNTATLRACARAVGGLTEVSVEVTRFTGQGTPTVVVGDPSLWPPPNAAA
jgi:hypothetical protein